MVKKNKTFLLILDGWGLGKIPVADAIFNANTPFVDSLYDKYPNSTLVTYGEEVGLPEGQMGNSEVGHLNIGAGRVVYQELARINKEIKEKTLFKNPVLLEAIEVAKKNNSAVHLLGLVSDGGVHSHINHLKALCDFTSDSGLEQIYIHAFLDGRDTAPNGGKNYLKDLLEYSKSQKVQLASIIGRYYAMDRDKRWERIKLAYDLLVEGKGEACAEEAVLEKVQQYYDEGITDEFMKPIAINTRRSAKIKEGDVVLFYNFRTDRPRELTEVLSQSDFPDHGMKKLNGLHFVTMTRYDEQFKNINVVFNKEDIVDTLGEVLSKAGKTQVRMAETEKYPHVTFFFSGGREAEFENEKRIVIPSPKVATYDLKPEMSALELTAAIKTEIEKNQPDFICLNFANTDMVGHTGDFEAAMIAANTVDTCVKELMALSLKHDYATLIIADHGNSDFMINGDGSAHTAHTKNLVPCFLVANNLTDVKLKSGKLADVAPTILAIMGVEQPETMTGNSLL